MALSVFDLFKVGIGPSSSHTVGPMRAARLFVRALEGNELLARVANIRVELYGSLGATGKGHGSDTAVLLGLAGHEPDTVDIDAIPGMLREIRDCGSLSLNETHRVDFQEHRDLLFYRRALPFHANGMKFIASDGEGNELHSSTFYSVGGGSSLANLCSKTAVVTPLLSRMAANFRCLSVRGRTARAHSTLWHQYCGGHAPERASLAPGC